MSTASKDPQSLSYRDAGVDIDAGNALVERIKPAVKTTLRPGVVTGLGGFGGLFRLDPDRYRVLFFNACTSLAYLDERAGDRDRPFFLVLSVQPPLAVL